MTRPLRVGFVAQEPLERRHAVSGMPASAASALRRAGVELVVLPVYGRRASPALPRLTWSARGALERRAASYSARLVELLRFVEIDVLFGLCVSYSLGAHRPQVPVVYSSDGTNRLLASIYGALDRRTRSEWDVCEDLERGALAVADAVVLPNEAARRSAIRDYGCPADRVHVVPFGANITPRSAVVPAAPPTSDSLALLLVASNPERKQLGFCIEVNAALRRRGIRADLRYVGPRRRQARRAPFVESLGRLRLDDPNDRLTLERAFAECHLLLLPSLAELVGLVTHEAAHFGRPAMVRDVGGLSESVRDGETGLVMEPDATPDDWADRISELVDDPVRYTRLASGALDRARRELDWDVWARRVVPILEAVTDRAAEAIPPVAAP